jgi:hypothetical protein
MISPTWGFRGSRRSYARLEVRPIEDLIRPPQPVALKRPLHRLLPLPS